MGTKIIDVRTNADPGRRQLILHCHNLWEYAKRLYAGRHVDSIELFCDDTGKPYVKIDTSNEGSKE